MKGKMTFASLAAACALAACGQPPNGAGTTASTLQECLSIDLSLADVAPEDLSKARAFQQRGCNCAHETLTSEDFSLIVPVQKLMVEMQEDYYSELGEYRLNSYLDSVRGDRSRTEMKEHIQEIEDVLNSTCAQPANE